MRNSCVTTKPIKLLAKALRLLPALASIALLWVPLPAAAQTSGQQKISPALVAEMAAHPLDRLPVIVEMNPTAAPFIIGINQTLAQQAVALLNANGQAFGGLSIVQGAAGIATSAGITALSLLPQVATIERDAVVRPRRPASGGPSWSSSQLTSLYPQETNANRVWTQGGSGRGVTVAVLDSGVAADQDLNGRVVASVGFAGARDPSPPRLRRSRHAYRGHHRR
jgi:serine protease AprX